MKKTKKKKKRSAPSYTTSVWQGCYDDSWKKIITEESFSHPAKMARGLLKRILKHLMKNHGLKRCGYYRYQYCTRCQFVLELERDSDFSSTKGIPHEMSALSKEICKDGPKAKVLQSSMRYDKSQNDDERKTSHILASQTVPSVRRRVSREEGSEVLQQEVRLHLDSSKQEKLSRGKDENQERVCLDSRSCPPSSKRRQVRDGASFSHGESSGKDAEKKRGSSSQERGQRRQSDREPRSNDKEETRQKAEAQEPHDLPEVRTRDSKKPLCPACKRGRLKTEVRWRNSDLVLDIFGGIGSTGIECSNVGLRSYLCELEPKFCELAKENFNRHKQGWSAIGLPIPVIVQGDSRQLRKNLGMVISDAVVSSPPYGDVERANHKPGEKVKRARAGRKDQKEGYGITEGQLGNMDGVISSPPYANISPEKSGKGIDLRKQWETYRKSGGGMSFKKFKAQQERHSQGYGKSKGQLGSLPEGAVDGVISSPPYAGSLQGDNSEAETAEESLKKRKTKGGSLGRSQRHAGYGGKDNLGNMDAGEVDAVVSSPPFEKSGESGGAR